MKSQRAWIGSWVDLPKLAVLTTEGDKDDSSSFTNPSIIDIESSACQTLWRVDLPQLTTVLLTNTAFLNQKKVTAKSRSLGFRSFIDAGALARYFKSGLPFFRNGNFIIWCSVYCDKYRVDGDYVKTVTAHELPYYSIRHKPSERDCSVSKRTLNSKTNTPPRKVNWNILDAEKLILEANLHTERKRQLHIIRRIIIRQALCVGIKHKLDVLLPRTIASRNLDGVTHQLYNLTPLCLHYARTAFHHEWLHITPIINSHPWIRFGRYLRKCPWWPCCTGPLWSFPKCSRASEDSQNRDGRRCAPQERSPCCSTPHTCFQSNTAHKSPS